MVRAVRFARWQRGGSARPRGAKPSFHVPFPSSPLWRERGRRCVATAPSPPGMRAFPASLVMEGQPPCHEEGGAGVASSLPFSSFLSQSPRVSSSNLPQTLAATAGSSPSHPLCVGRLDPGRFQAHPPQPATPASSEERARACSSLATRIRRWWPPPTSS
jgi:hypothetical protein